METRAQLHPTASRPRWKGILLGLLAAALLCANVVLALVLLRFPAPTPPQPEALEQDFENREYGIRLRLPGSWSYMDAVSGHEAFVMEFASSERALKDLPGSPRDGVGILLFAGSKSIKEQFPAGADVQKMNELTAADQFRVFGRLEGPKPLKVKGQGVEASSGLYLFALDDREMFLNTGGRNRIAYLAVIRRGQELIRFIAVCPPNQWLDHRPTVEAILASLEISPRQK